MTEGVQRSNSIGIYFTSGMCSILRMARIFMFIVARPYHDSLLEYFPVSMFISLAIRLDSFFPAPHIFKELFILRLCSVQFGKFITFEIWSHVKRRLSILSTNNECSLNDAIVGNAVD